MGNNPQLSAVIYYMFRPLLGHYQRVPIKRRSYKDTMLHTYNIKSTTHSHSPTYIILDLVNFLPAGADLKKIVKTFA